jgi:hypothetical protein
MFSRILLNIFGSNLKCLSRPFQQDDLVLAAQDARFLLNYNAPTTLQHFHKSAGNVGAQERTEPVQRSAE